MMNPQRVSSLAGKELKRMVREPAVLFMFLLFPVVLTLVFGLSFGGIGGGGQTSFKVGYVNADSGEYPSWARNLLGNLSAMAILDLEEYADNESAQDDLGAGDIQGVLLIPAEFGRSAHSYWISPDDPASWVNVSLPLYVDAGSMAATQTIPPVVRQIVGITIFGEVPRARSISVGTPSLVTSREFTMYDYFVPGLFAYAAIFIIMIVGQSLTTDREKGLLRRINTTPTTASEFITAHVIANMVAAFLQVILIFAMALLMGYNPGGGTASLLMAFIIVVVFSLCCVGFGLVTASVSKSSGAATGISFIFILPMMFLGTFVGFALSSGMQSVSRLVPSWWVTDALTSLFMRGASITSPQVLLNLGVVGIYSIVVLILGTVLFDKYGNA
jgi:ABC-2 type transport system permease protein